MFNKEDQVERNVHEELWNYFWEDSFDIIREYPHLKIDGCTWNKVDDNIKIVTDSVYNMMRNQL